VEEQLLVGRIESEGKTGIRLHTDRGGVLLRDMDKSFAGGGVDFYVEQQKKHTGVRLVFKWIIAVLDIDGSCPVRDGFDGKFLLRGRHETKATGEEKQKPDELDALCLQPKTWTATSWTQNSEKFLTCLPQV
jgi:hypothetical protein